MAIYATQRFLLRVFAVLILTISGSPLAVWAVDLPILENYESVRVGDLPATHNLGQGGAQVAETAQKGGGIGKVLVVNEGSRITIDPGASSDVSISADIKDNSQSGYIGIQMSPDGSNGYILEYNSISGLIILSKISNGFRATLGFTSVSAPRDGWNRIILETRGSHIRGAVLGGGHILSGEIRAYDYDGAYSFGDVALGKEAGRGPATVLFDNLEIKTAPILINPVSVKLPQIITFNTADLAMRNGLTLHPNIDLVRGGYALGIFKDKNGSESNVLTIPSGSYAKIKSDLLPNYIFKVDLDDGGGGAWIGARMSPDAENGYQIFFDSSYKILDLYRLIRGERMLLARAFVYRPLSGWYKLSIELDGSAIRASLEDFSGTKLGSISASDGFYKSGFILFGKDFKSFGKVAKFGSMELGGNLTDSDNDGVIDSHDDCKYQHGLAAYRGCLLAYKTKVYIGISGLEKSGVCPTKSAGNFSKECLLPFKGGVVKVYDRERADFLLAYGRRPESNLFRNIYESETGKVRECVSDNNGDCVFGTRNPGPLLVVAKYAAGHQLAYAGKIINFRSPLALRDCRGLSGEICDDDDPVFASLSAKRALIVKELKFEKTVYPNGSFVLKASGEKINEQPGNQASVLVRSPIIKFLANLLDLLGF